MQVQKVVKCTIVPVVYSEYSFILDNLDIDTEILIIFHINEAQTVLNNLPYGLKYLILDEYFRPEETLNKYFPKIPFDCKVLYIKGKQHFNSKTRGEYYTYKITPYESLKDLVKNNTVEITTISDDERRDKFYFNITETKFELIDQWKRYENGKELKNPKH